MPPDEADVPLDDDDVVVDDDEPAGWWVSVWSLLLDWEEWLRGVGGASNPCIRIHIYYNNVKIRRFLLTYIYNLVMGNIPSIP